MLRRLTPFAVCSLLVLGCSDDDHSSHPPADTGSTPADTASGDTGTPTDTGAADAPMEAAAFSVVNECEQADYVDATMDEALRKLDPWDASAGKKCFKIKTTQSFTWKPTGGFSIHPLEPEGGDTPTPITLVSSGTTKTIAFPNSGVFGYRCANHPSLMFGAIWVTP